jgi:hypothetical protein
MHTVCTSGTAWNSSNQRSPIGTGVLSGNSDHTLLPGYMAFYIPWGMSLLPAGLRPACDELRQQQVAAAVALQEDDPVCTHSLLCARYWVFATSYTVLHW